MNTFVKGNLKLDQVQTNEAIVAPNGLPLLVCKEAHQFTHPKVHA